MKAREAERAIDAPLETHLLDRLGEGVCQLRLLRDDSGRVFDWEYLYANPAIEALFQGGPLTGQRCSQAFPRLHQANIPLRRFLDETDLAGEARTFECHVLPQGRWLRLSATCVAPGILAVVTHEITERVRLGRALQNQEDRLRVALAAARAGAFDWDTATGECVWSTGTFACFGYTPDEVVPTVESWTSRTHPEDLPQVLNFVADASRRGDSEFQMEFRVIWPTGAVHWLRSQGRLAYDPGRLVRMIGMVIDITASKQLELELLSTRDELERRVRERTDQLARLSSELILAEQRERDRIARVLHDGLQQVLYAAQLIIGTLGSQPDLKVRSIAQEVTTLMDEAARQARTLTAEISPAAVHGGDFNAALRWLSAWAQRAYGLRVSFVTATSDRVPEALQVLLYQSARELLFNVAKHAQVSEARIELACETDGDAPLLRLSVQDRGLGFDPAAPPPAGALASSGLGLFGIRERLAPLGGRLQIQSARGNGTQVTIRLPLSRPPHRP